MAPATGYPWHLGRSVGGIGSKALATQTQTFHFHMGNQATAAQPTQNLSLWIDS